MTSPKLTPARTLSSMGMFTLAACERCGAPCDDSDFAEDELCGKCGNEFVDDCRKADGDVCGESLDWLGNPNGPRCALRFGHRGGHKKAPAVRVALAGTP